MTCPACNATLAPGAYCDGNGTHPPRRAKRLRGAAREAEIRRREAERLAAETERGARVFRPSRRALNALTLVAMLGFVGPSEPVR